IIDRYDIILIQEVRDKDGKVTNRIMDLVNEDIPNDSPDHFDNISSVYLPVTKDNKGHKERYLFLYKKETVSVNGSFQYNDTAGVFDRPPFVVQFSSTQTAGKDFVLIPIHTQPLKYPKEGKKSTLQQLQALGDVVEAAAKQWKNNNIVVLGDFNAGSNYVRKSDWEKIPLFTDKKFHSLIKDVATTLAEKTIQTHDRIVVSDEMKKGVVEGSAKVFDFIKAYNPVEPGNISDHFPVEVELKLKLLMKRSRPASGGGVQVIPLSEKK
ncbi:hypothetical protein KUCAC02_035802, partial [Chaenocephalus aceratus]